MAFYFILLLANQLAFLGSLQEIQMPLWWLGKKLMDAVIRARKKEVTLVSPLEKGRVQQGGSLKEKTR